MVQPSPHGFGHIDREELDDEQIIVHSFCFTCEVVILQLDAAIGFSIVLGDRGTRPFGTKVVSFMIIAALAMRVLLALLGLLAVVPRVIPPIRLRF
jgi:hypothetical protein